MARDVNLRLFVDDGGGSWRAATNGDFVGVKLTGAQDVEGAKTWHDDAVFANGFSLTGAANAFAYISGGSSNFVLFGPSAGGLSFQTAAGAIGLSIGADASNTNSFAYVPEIDAAATTRFVLGATTAGAQTISDDLTLSGNTYFSGNVQFGSSTFTANTTAKSNFATTFNSHLVAINGSQTIVGSKTFSAALIANSAVTTNGELNINGAISCSSSEVEFTSVSDFIFDATSLESFKEGVKTSLATIGTAQTITGAKTWTANQVFEGTNTFSGSTTTIDDQTLNLTSTTFSLDSNSATSLAGQLGSSFVDVSNTQSVGGYKKFDKISVNYPASEPHVGKEFLMSGDAVFKGVTFDLDAASSGSLASELVIVDRHSDQTISGDKTYKGTAQFDSSVSFVSTAEATELSVYTSLTTSSASLSYLDSSFSFDASSLYDFASVVSGRLVATTGAQNISGSKTFFDDILFDSASLGTVAAPASALQLDGDIALIANTTDLYVMNAVQASFADVLCAGLTTTDPSTFGDDITVNGNVSASNLVYNTGTQTIAGEKTFATAVEIDGTFAARGTVLIDTSLTFNSPAAPATAASAGTQGEIRWDNSYIYVCTGTNSWTRVAISTW